MPCSTGRIGYPHAPVLSLPEPIAIGILQHPPEQVERLLLGCRHVREFNSVGIEIGVIVLTVEVKKVRHRLPLHFFMKAAGGFVFPIEHETAVEPAGLRLRGELAGCWPQRFFGRYANA
jgi:hypothetical protein